MSYLYNELPPQERADAERHLQQCAACREGVDQWRETVRVLDTDRIETPVHARSYFANAAPLRWAAMAAGIAVVIGFGLGRSTSVSRAEMQAELTRVRESISQELRDQYREDLREVARSSVAASSLENRELLARVVGEFNQVRVADRQDWLATLERLEEKRESQYLSLKAGVIDLARSTRSGFLQTENNLNLLAATLPIDGGDPAGSNAEPSVQPDKLP